MPLELADGSVRPLPGIWQDLRTPPMDPSSETGIEEDTYNLPTSFVVGTTPTIEALFSAELAGGFEKLYSRVALRLRRIQRLGSQRVLDLLIDRGRSHACRAPGHLPSDCARGVRRGFRDAGLSAAIPRPCG